MTGSLCKIRSQLTGGETETCPLSAAVCSPPWLCGAGWVHERVPGGSGSGQGGTPSFQVLASSIGRNANLPNVNTFINQL